MDVMISIIVPIYNVENYIEKCIESLVSQSFENIEIILVNDGSTDNSLDICYKYSRIYSKIKVFTQENSGLSPTRNKGIKEAVGKYILFVDSDDWIDSITCEVLFKHATQYNLDAVLFSSVSEYSNNQIYKPLYDEKDTVFDTQKSVREFVFKKMIGLENNQLKYPHLIDRYISAWGKLYSTKIIKENSIFFKSLKEVPSEALLFNMEYFYYCNKASYINKYFYHYRRDNQDSITKKYKEDLIKKWSN